MKKGKVLIYSALLMTCLYLSLTSAIVVNETTTSRTENFTNTLCQADSNCSVDLEIMSYCSADNKYCSVELSGACAPHNDANYCKMVYETTCTYCPNGCETSGCKEVSTECRDSDGDSIYSKGTTTGLWENVLTTKTDFCESSEKVKEFYCSDNKIQYKLIACPEGKVCKEGACVHTSNTTQVCKDSDDGKDFYNQGTVFVAGNPEGKTDYCIYDGKLTEYYCSNGEKSSYTYKCEYGCTLGACNKIAPKVITHEGTYEVKKGTVIEIGEARAQIVEIAWVTDKPDKPWIWINAHNAQTCRIGEGEICTIYDAGPVTTAAPYLKIIANEIEIEEDHPEKSEAKISIRLVRETKEETVTCVFIGDTEEDRKCYFDSDGRELKCEAGELTEDNKSSCSVSITGGEGSKFAWKSSCGGYQYTTMDGTDETVTFTCLKDDKIDDDHKKIIKEHWFKSAYWECYNGDILGETQDIDRSNVCKPYGLWKSEAVHFCQDKCNREKDYDEDDDDNDDDKLKCGVNSFAVSQECYPSGDNATLSNETQDSDVGLICKDSCPLNGKCYQFGYRKSGNYCSDSGAFVEQLKPEKKCDNNFECSSNVCISNQCISEGAIKKFFKWLSSIFG